MSIETLERPAAVSMFFNEDVADKAPEMKADIERRYKGHGYASLTVTAYERQTTGWLEWAIGIKYKEGGSMFVAAIQRTHGADIEYHS